MGLGASNGKLGFTSAAPEQARLGVRTWGPSSAASPGCRALELQRGDSGIRAEGCFFLSEQGGEI